VGDRELLRRDLSVKRYFINEIFYSLQGEGVRAGSPSLFLRFGKCNMRCRKEASPRSPGGFDCDTEFESGRWLTRDEIVNELTDLTDSCKWIVLTGGEPGLQVDEELVAYLHDQRYQLAIETNGSIGLPQGFDWITVSPKVAEHALRQRTATEVKYVRGCGQAIPHTAVEADYYLISPAFEGTEVSPKTLAWCIDLCEANPQWRLSVQQHKVWGLR
jgi:7-carboxy-7-deazaguanine synthase